MLKKLIKKSVRNRIFNRWSLSLAGEEALYAKRNRAENLTAGEVSAVKKVWHGICSDLRVGYSAFSAWKLNYGFDASYVPFGYFFPWIVRVLNPVDAARVLANKGLSNAFFSNIKQPKLLVRKVNGCIYDWQGKSLTTKNAASCIKEECTDVVVKQSSGSCSGYGVKKILATDSINDITDVLESYKGDFIAQCALKQSPITAKFNGSSVNTFRVSSLLLNGKFSVCTSMLRFGSPGSAVDNVGSGGGCVGIDEDGSLMPFGFNKTGDRIKEWNGITFEGYKILEYEKIIATAKAAHYNIPLCAFVGWDLALDENGDVNMIEANLEWPGLFFEQLANGRPVFGDRFEEVLDYVRKHPLPLSPMYNAVV